MQIRFSFNTKYGVYSDALNLADDHSFTEEEISAMKQARLDRWLSNIESPPTLDVLPIEEPVVSE